jgi:teichuronic acid exporter
MSATASLGVLARAAVLWNAGFNIFKDILQFVITMVLARMLSEQNYGQLDLVTKLMGFLIIFSFQGFVAHALQVKSDEEARFQHHFTFGAGLNLGVFLLANTTAFCLRFFPAWAPAAPFLHAMSITFLLDVPCEIRRKMIERQFDWKRLRILHGVGLLLNLVAAIGMAWAGWGTYALILPSLGVQLPFIYDLFVTEKWRPDWSFDRSTYREAFSFGLNRSGSGLMLSVRNLLESATLVATLGFGGLGLLTRALGLAQQFCQKIGSQLVYALYPMLTRVDDPARTTGLVLRYIAWFTIPMALVVSFLAMPVIITCYGDQWTASVALVPWAMLWGALAAVNQTCYMLLLSRNHAKACLLTDLLSFAGTLAALFLALPGGAMVYLQATAATQAIVLIALILTLHRHRLLAWRGLAEAILPPLLAGTASAAAVWLLCNAVAGKQPSTFWSALLWGCCFLVFHTLALRLFFTGLLRDVTSRLPGSGFINRLLRFPQPA